MDGIIGTLVWAIKQFNATHYSTVALMTLYTIDYFHTLITEITFLWPTPWTIVKVMFFISRYSPFLDGPIGIASFAVSSPSIKLCGRLLKANIWLSGIGQISAYVLFSYRAYALVGRTRLSAILFSFLAAAITATAFALLVKIHQSVSVMSPTNIRLLPGCLAATTNTFTIAGTIASSGFETILFGTVYWARAKKYKEGGNRLMRKIYGDALVYYLLSIVISITGIIVWFASNGPILELAATVPKTLISMVSCKIILNIRKYGNVHQLSDTNHNGAGGTRGTAAPISGLRFEHGGQSTDIDTDLGLH